MQECKCSHCIKWVFCKTKGFCLVKDLFTYTELEEDAVCDEEGLQAGSRRIEVALEVNPCYIWQETE